MKKPVVHGIGVDIEDVDRFKGILRKPRFLKRVYTEKELRYCGSFASPEGHLAARFAAKEAVVKALGAARKEIGFSDIEILNEKESGAPFVNMKKKGLKEKFSFFISLSHSKERAMAFSVIVKGAR